MAEEWRLTAWGKKKKGEEGEGKGTISMCWTHDRCPWPFAEWLPCWQELTSVFKQDKTNGTSSPPAHWTSPFLFQLTASSPPCGNANVASWHCWGWNFITPSYCKVHFTVTFHFVKPFFFSFFSGASSCYKNNKTYIQFRPVCLH